MNRNPPILNKLYAREKQLLYENSVLKVQHNEMVSAINTLQSEIETMVKKNNENQKNHANSLIFLQNHNAHLNKTLNLKQKQLQFHLLRLMVQFWRKEFKKLKDNTFQKLLKLVKC